MSNVKKGHRGGVNLWGEHTSTVISITLVLFVFGLLMFIGYHSYRLTNDVQERITYKVDLQPEVSDSLATALQKNIQQFDYVKQVDYISRDQAAELFAEEIGDDFVEFIGYNPLYPSLMVNFKSGLVPDRDQRILQSFSETVSKMEGVTGVQYQENVVKELTNEFFLIDWVLFLFAVLLLFVTVILIRSTIRIAIYAQQPTIHTMRMVGATNGFVARPFLWRSVLYGTIGSLIAIVLTVAVVTAYCQQFGLKVLGPEYTLPYILMAAGILVAGILISWISTYFAVHHYLR